MPIADRKSPVFLLGNTCIIHTHSIDTNGISSTALAVIPGVVKRAVTLFGDRTALADTIARPSTCIGRVSKAVSGIADIIYRNLVLLAFLRRLFAVLAAIALIAEALVSLAGAVSTADPLVHIFWQTGLASTLEMAYGYRIEVTAAHEVGTELCTQACASTLFCGSVYIRGHTFLVHARSIDHNPVFCARFALLTLCYAVAFAVCLLAVSGVDARPAVITNPASCDAYLWHTVVQAVIECITCVTLALVLSVRFLDARTMIIAYNRGVNTQ